jgi:SAM-dependent methyltransferase
VEVPQLDDQKREWEEIAGQDALWAILSYSDRKRGGWTQDEFFRTGELEVEALMARVADLGHPIQRGAALDFGCGVGRVTRALADHFDECLGLDISETMVAAARTFNGDRPACRFEVNDRFDLGSYADWSFDLVYTRIVLQHLPSRAAIERYLAEFIRTLTPNGLLVFQLPSALPLTLRLQPRRRAYLLLRRAGMRSEFLYWRLGLHPMRMRHIPSADVIALLNASGARVLDIEARQDSSYGFDDSVYYVTRA